MRLVSVAATMGSQLRSIFIFSHWYLKSMCGSRSVYSFVLPPGGNVRELNEQSLRRLRSGSFPVFQLDATAYPGNSGGPMYDAETGEVLGIVNMVFVKSTKEAVLQHPSGISYAIPADYLIELLGRSRP